MTLRARTLTLVSCCLLGVCASADPKYYTVLVPVFEVTSTERSISESERLGNKVATLINLRLFLTLRVPPPSEAQSRPGRGEVTWDSDSLPPRTADEADDLARGNAPEAFITVWGTVDAVGNDVVVNPRISIRDEGSDENLWDEFWTVRTSNNASVEIRATPLSNRYEFLPIPLKKELLPDLISPGGLPIYDLKGRQRLGTAGDYFTNVEKTKGSGYDGAVIMIPGKPGKFLIKIPELSSESTELEHFTSGLLRLFRHDWRNACDDFEEVERVKWTTRAVRRDAGSYLSLCLGKLGYHEQAIAAAQRATESGQPNFGQLKYWAMALAEAFSAKASTSDRARYLSALIALQGRLSIEAKSRHEIEWLDELGNFLNNTIEVFP